MFGIRGCIFSPFILFSDAGESHTSEICTFSGLYHSGIAYKLDKGIRKLENGTGVLSSAAKVVVRGVLKSPTFNC